MRSIRDSARAESTSRRTDEGRVSDARARAGTAGAALTSKLRSLGMSSLLRQEIGFFDHEENSATQMTGFLAEKARDTAEIRPRYGGDALEMRSRCARGAADIACPRVNRASTWPQVSLVKSLTTDKLDLLAQVACCSCGRCC